MILTTIVLGQLTAQVNAANCMLDFINTYFMLFSTYVSLGIEFSGLLHCVYLVQLIFSKITGTPIDTKEPPRNLYQKLFFWSRVLVSLAILAFSFAVTLDALFKGQTTMWDACPPAVSVVVFFILMAFVGMMEGMQIALFAAVNMPKEEIEHATIAKKNCDLTFKGQNLQAFLIGRQICVTCCMFVVARITTLNIGPEDDNIFGVSDGIQNFFNTGLLGALITTIVASLAWRIIASSFPLAFLSNPLIYLIIRLCLLLDMTGICSAAWIFARGHKMLAKFKPDEVYLEGTDPSSSNLHTTRDHDIDITITVFKYMCSLALIIFSVVILMTAIFTNQTQAATKNIPPIAAFFIFWLLILWLAMIEGGQGALVGLQPIDNSRYAKSHSISFKCTLLAHKGDNMERFIVGRQFLVLLIVFVINLMGSAVPDASVLGLPDVVNIIFLNTGIAMILTTIVLGQLTAQVNAANCMLDFINSYFMLFSTYVSLGIDFSGLLHSVYLVQLIFSKITGKPVYTNEPPRGLMRNLFFWSRVLVSLAILALSFAVTLKALFDGNTTIWAEDSVPPAVSITIFFILMAFVGMMEGIQIALFAVINMPEEEIATNKVAHANCKLTFKGQNLQAFLIGRQICVTSFFFIVARIITPNIGPEDDNIFGVSDGVQNFFNTGILGAVITTIVASLSWRIIASSFPMIFLSNPLIYLIIRFCLIIEHTGICSASWVFGRYHRMLIDYQPDEVYLEDANPWDDHPHSKRDKEIDITV